MSTQMSYPLPCDKGLADFHRNGLIRYIFYRNKRLIANIEYIKHIVKH